MLTRIKDTQFGRFLRQQRFLNVHRPERTFYGQFLRKGDLVFDVGANIGNKATIFRSLGARVVCFEPQPAMCIELRRRFCHDANVVIEPVALGASIGQGTLLICPDLPEVATLAESSITNGRFANRLRNAATHVIQIVTIDEMIYKHGLPRFCKIDVEGYELQVLRGLRSRIPMVSLEVNIEFLGETKQCIKRLVELGLERFNFSVGDTNHFVYSRWLNGDEIAHFLDAQTDALFWGDLYAQVA